MQYGTTNHGESNNVCGLIHACPVFIAGVFAADLCKGSLTAFSRFWTDKDTRRGTLLTPFVDAHAFWSVQDSSGLGRAAHLLKRLERGMTYSTLRGMHVAAQGDGSARLLPPPWNMRCKAARLLQQCTRTMVVKQYFTVLQYRWSSIRMIRPRQAPTLQRVRQMMYRTVHCCHHLGNRRSRLRPMSSALSSVASG